MFRRDGLGVVAMMATNALLGWLTGSAPLTSGAHAQDKPAAKAAAGAQTDEISIEPFNSQGEFIRHKGFQGFVDPILTPLDAQDARFKQVPGLADNKGVSFESTNHPGNYLRHRSGRLILTKCPELLDKQDATFVILKGLGANGDGWLSLQPLMFPGQLLQNRNGELWTGPRQEGADFAKSATFRFDKPTAHRKPPISGTAARNTFLFDAVMLKYMEKIGCTAAEFAATRNGVLVESRGYGWSDQRGKVPMRSNNPMGIGSCEKCITAAAVKQLARAGQLDLNASVFKLLKIEPHGKVVDERVRDITLNHLLDHKAGWQGEPFERSEKEYRAQGRARLEASAPWVPSRDNDTEKWLGFVMVQKLADAPGTKKIYCNFCYDVLRLVVAKTTGRHCSDYIRHQLFRPFGIAEMKGIHAPGVQVAGEPPQVWNAVSVDFDGYPVQPSSPIRASAPALCTFMRCFWAGSGEARDNGNWFWTMNGSTDNATATICQRVDEKIPDVDFVFIFNGRAEGVGHDQIQKELTNVIKKLRGIR